jgi:radical SAM superfamily enzyme YgiQ (UPF0313 family)
MSDLLLTHGYFLSEDPKELQIRKPYVPLGILYICSHLRSKGFAVEVFDSTFSTKQELIRHLQTEKPSILGVYANLITRKNVVEILRVARDAGWRTIVGGPEPGAYVREYLEAGAEVVVLGEGELTMEELLPALRATSTPALEIFVGLPSSPRTVAFTKLRLVRKSRISTTSHGRPAMPLMYHVMCTPGAKRMATDRSPSSPRAVVPTIAAGAVTRCLAKLTGAEVPALLSTKSNGSFPPINPTWFGLPTTFSPFTTAGCENTPRKCTGAACVFPLNVFPVPIVSTRK